MKISLSLVLRIEKSAPPSEPADQVEVVGTLAERDGPQPLGFTVPVPERHQY